MQSTTLYENKLMGLKLKRKKKKHFLLSFIYRLNKFIPINKRSKLKLFLDLEWIFNRLALEYSFKNYSHDNHPNRVHSGEYILNNINSSERVLDLGCKQGDIAKIISTKAKYVLGIDYDEKAIKSAIETHQIEEKLEFVCAEAYQYLKNNETNFDVLILSHVLEHIDNPKEFLSLFSPYFKKIYVEVPDFEMNYLNNYRKDFNVKLIYSDNDHVFEFDRDEITNLLDSCGLKIERAEYRYGVQKIWCNHK